MQKSVNRLQIGTVLIEPHLRHTFFGRQCSTKKSSADYGGGGVGHHRHCDTGPLGRHRHRYLPISIIIEQNGGGSFLSFFLSFIFFSLLLCTFPLVSYHSFFVLPSWLHNSAFGLVSVALQENKGTISHHWHASQWNLNQLAISTAF